MVTMPEPPPESLHVRWILENPWPLGATLLLIGAVVGWMGLRDGVLNRQRAGFVIVMAGLLVVAAGFAITTSGEHAKGVVKDLLRRAESADITGASTLFAADASISFGRPENPGLGAGEIFKRLDLLAGPYRIKSNTVTTLKGYSESAEMGVVHLGCLTTVEAGYGPTPSQWVLKVKRQSSGAWEIVRITLVSAAGRPGSEMLR